MEPNLDILFEDSKFKKIQYFLNEQGITDFDELCAFDLDEIIFIPGLSIEIIEEFKENVYSYKEEAKTKLSMLNNSNEYLEIPEWLMNTQILSIIDRKLIDRKLENLFKFSHIETVKDWLHFEKDKMSCKRKNNLIKFENEITNKINELKGMDLVAVPNEYFNSEIENIPINFLPEILQMKISEIFNGVYITKISDIYSLNLTPVQWYLLEQNHDDLNKSLDNMYLDKIKNIDERSLSILRKRASGETLNTIGIQYNLTRERVRQIIKKTISKIINYAEIRALSKVSISNPFIRLEDLYFDEEEERKLYFFILKNSNIIIFSEMLDKFIFKSSSSLEVELRLTKIMKDIIGQYGNLYDLMDKIIEELEENNLDFIDMDDIQNCLIANDYTFYGDFVIKRGSSYVYSCIDAIRRYFNFDLKLDQDEGNEDMKKLRNIIFFKYPGIELPEKNRALFARITDFPEIILSGRGRYCPIEKVYFHNELIEDIRKHILRKEQNTFYYSELFELFKGRLLLESNIDNYNFLHGIIKWCYPDDFEYRRDYLNKNSKMSDETYDDRIISLAKKGPVTKKEIKKYIPGIQDYTISFILERNKKIIMWDTHTYVHVDSLNICQEFIGKLDRILQYNILKYDGFISEQILYDEFMKIDSSIDYTPKNLFYISSYFFDELYDFRIPNIAKKNLVEGNLSTEKIVETMLIDEQTGYFEYANLDKFASKMKWKYITKNNAMNNLTSKLIRIDQYTYLKKDKFYLSENKVNKINQSLRLLLGKYDFMPYERIVDFRNFPDINLEWNHYLLRSIIENYDSSYRSINKLVKDIRYNKSFIVPKESELYSYEQIVISVIKNRNLLEISQIELRNILLFEGLTNENIPQELYSGINISYDKKKEKFILN
ncbi:MULTISPECIES: sigma factor-like helix-turn-helix DNA-binding protein [unclassified Enterococcus]|uniref:sigma factor-like helix-turn-helix DNA-binding protein n=1 Tax=unclassified Enterococcus TaxID=2608891 RepID=UPI001CE14DEC|nr:MULTISPECIES: sigma factor-like helix-turn-helix DNA-binding protein [unclassified Enterococcus]MCA5011774.1 hypothetical protein [Enterococcus sp. S23]MCA5014784.1 hypothetical protein [Enterococcus sp. S22(2020)]